MRAMPPFLGCPAERNSCIGFASCMIVPLAWIAVTGAFLLSICVDVSAGGCHLGRTAPRRTLGGGCRLALACDAPSSSARPPSPEGRLARPLPMNPHHASSAGATALDALDARTPWSQPLRRPLVSAPSSCSWLCRAPAGEKPS
eukprot:2868679-Prymnesium_polylepis.1